MWAVVELILLILVIDWLGTRCYWHVRWIDYRLLAEQLRHLHFLAPLGHTLPSLRVQVHDIHGDPRHSWVHSHCCATIGEAGLTLQSPRGAIQLLEFFAL